MQLTKPGQPNSASALAGDIAARNGQQREALMYFTQSINDFNWLGHRISLGLVLARVATLIADREPEAAAVLHGKGDALAPGWVHSPHHHDAIQQATEVLDASLGPARRYELYSHGMAISDADAVDCANTAIARHLNDEPAGALSTER